MREGKGDPPANLHPWVQQAHRDLEGFRANPTVPKILALVDGGVLRSLPECNPDDILHGDAVAFTFGLSYIKGRDAWYPSYTLHELVRVACDRAAQMEAATAGVVVLEASHRRALDVGESVYGASYT